MDDAESYVLESAAGCHVTARIANMDDAKSYVLESAAGCHVATSVSSPWLLGVHKLQRWCRELGVKPARLPELSLEPHTKVLSLINRHDKTHVYFVTVCHPCIGRMGVLASGWHRDSSGHSRSCVTLIVAVPSRRVVDACCVQIADVHDAELESDIVPLHGELAQGLFAQQPAGECAVLGFPLPSNCRYLCSQGVCGAFTHRWHPSTYHAIDLEAPTGTPVLAVADGHVVELRDGVRSGGCHVCGFFQYNALTIAHDVPPKMSALDGGGQPSGCAVLFIEYVHLRAGSSRVAVGDWVDKGQQIAEVGDAGFCPVPHLHIEAHRERHAKAPSVPIAFERQEGCAGYQGDSFVPVAGGWYQALRGCVDPPLAGADRRASASERVNDGDGMPRACPAPGYAGRPPPELAAGTSSCCANSLRSSNKSHHARAAPAAIPAVEASFEY